MVSILTPLESNVYSKLGFRTHTTPSESNVYSKLGFRKSYDSFGVERVFERINFYKHAIPSGLVLKESYVIYFERLIY